jgi:tRNA pseudouridine38-40 synthase
MENINMKRLKCTLAYDGTNFSGYQVQPNCRTVQLMLEQALAKMHKDELIRVSASGRTDAQVHAVGQVIHFDTPLEIPLDHWKRALNSLLPNDITILNVENVDYSFHARFDVVKKEYRYMIHTGVQRDVFKRNYVYHYTYQLDYNAIKEGMLYLTGTHDFTSFCSAKTDVEDKVRTIYEIDVIQNGNEVEFRFVGNGFLYNMVRIIVGTLLDVGRCSIKPHQIKDILKEKDRSLAGKTVPGHGLYLWKVTYDN